MLKVFMLEYFDGFYNKYTQEYFESLQDATDRYMFLKDQGIQAEIETISVVRTIKKD